MPKVAIGAIVASLLVAGDAHAAVYSNGNFEPVAVNYVQGQSFTPSIQVQDRSGTLSSVSGQVQLTLFAIDFYTPAAAPSALYIYTSAPSVPDASAGTSSLVTGSYVENGAYDFTTAVSPSFNTKYFAVLPVSADIYDGSGSTYAGGLGR